MDVPVFATGFYEKFGYDRPVYTLSHDMLFNGPQGEFLIRTGFIRANHENADEALRSGGVVVVFPGGDYDVYRPTLAENKIDFDGRTGYVRAALNAGVPIVPAVAHRRSGDPALPVPRHGIGQGAAAGQADAGEDPADLGGLPVRAFRGGAGQRAAAGQDRDAGAGADRRDGRVRRGARTSTRSTPMSAASCRRRSTSWPKSVASR